MLWQELDSTTIKLKDLNFGMRAATHDPFKCYKASKIALTLFGKELARRTAETQVTVVLADPGVCGETNLFQCVRCPPSQQKRRAFHRPRDACAAHRFAPRGRYMGPLVIMFAFAKPSLQTLPQVSPYPPSFIEPDQSSCHRFPQALCWSLHSTRSEAITTKHHPESWCRLMASAGSCNAFVCLRRTRGRGG